MKRLGYKGVYDGLLKQHGPQQWWPADNAFEVMVGAVLTQNTAWTNVEKAIVNLKRARALSLKRMATMPLDELAQLIRPSGYFNLKAKRLQAFCQWLSRKGGVARLTDIETPLLRDELLAVYGIGPETADDMLLYALDRPVFVIDAYTRRIFSRLDIIDGGEPYDELRADFERRLQGDIDLYGEYHALIVNHGKDVCRKSPVCNRCQLAAHCAYVAAR